MWFFPESQREPVRATGQGVLGISGPAPTRRTNTKDRVNTQRRLCPTLTTCDRTQLVIQRARELSWPTRSAPNERPAR